MRGAFLIMMMIALLIVGTLVVKNLTSDTVDETAKIEAIDRTREVTQVTDQKNKEIIDRLNQAMPDGE